MLKVAEPRETRDLGRRRSLAAVLFAHIIDAIRGAIASASASLLPHRDFDGIRLVIFSGSTTADDDFERLISGLNLIRAYDRIRYDRLRREMPRVALVSAGGEVYDHGIRTYFADRGVMQQRSIEEIAMALVHEATHARISSRGIKTTGENVMKIEHLCVHQEIEFAKRLPDPDELVRHAKGKLEQPWWGPGVVANRAVERLEALNAPSWLVRLVRVMHNRE